MTKCSDNSTVSKVMWTPKKFFRTNIDSFREEVNLKYNLNLKDYWELHEWSIQSYDCFWKEFLDFSKIICSSPYTEVVDKSKRIDQIPKWFVGAKLNYAENILERPGLSQSKTALFIASEGSDCIETVTFGQMKKRVALLASAMNKMGIAAGDRVVGYLPNGRDAVECLLASAAIGAVWSSTSPDFGVAGVLDRICQIKPKLIISVNAVIYNGKRHNHLEKLKQVVQALDGVKKVVVSVLKTENCSKKQKLDDELDLTDIPLSCTFEDFLASADPNEALNYRQVSFDYPLAILFSSGTTGKPKCLVHSVGGTLIKHLEEHILQGNMNSDDILMYYTTVGWMMWNWMVSALALGASVVLYDGSPFFPNANVLWDLCDKIGITVLGTSAKGIQTMEQFNLEPKKTHKLCSLHTILSTGSPLKPQSFEFIYNKVKSDVLLGSISGGSDIIACFMGQNTTIPVHIGEIQSKHLGIAIECWNEEGKSVVGMKGELVCKVPFPSMPIFFWDDEDGSKYQNAYFSQFPGVWTHGDFIWINPETNGLVMHGRSDGTLNPNGIRFGSSEIYNIVESYKEIIDSVCVSQYNCRGEERIVLFLKMAQGFDLDDQIVFKIKSDIRTNLSARHVPSVILKTEDIPYTVNGKKVEVAVKMIINGKGVNNKNALVNPEALELFRNLPQLQDF